jgi:hypothetical protein
MRHDMFGMREDAIKDFYPSLSGVLPFNNFTLMVGQYAICFEQLISDNLAEIIHEAERGGLYGLVRGM